MSKNELTKSEMFDVIAKLEAELEAEKAKGMNMKARVIELIDSGVNSIDDLASELSVTNKNISSVLCSLRKTFAAEGKIIITQQFEGRSMIAIANLADLGWITADQE